MESSVASAKDTLQDLTSAVEIMKNNPARFNLSVEDVAKRETQVQALRYVAVREERMYCIVFIFHAAAFLRMCV